MDQQPQSQQQQSQRGRRNNYGGRGNSGGRFNHSHHNHHYPHHNHHSHSRGASHGRSDYYPNPPSSQRSGAGGGSDLNNNQYYMSQQIAMCHQRVLTLEEKNRGHIEELEYYRYLVQQLTQNMALQQQQFAAEKEVIIAKAKADTMSQLIAFSGSRNMWNDPFLTSDPKLKLENVTAEYISHHPLLSSATYHAWSSESFSPCLQPMPTLGGNGIMSDLRDRYEDIKCFGYLERNEKTDWIMKMMRKIVGYYEKNNMRVYEEALPNQYVSTLIWCPNDSLCPQKSESSFSFGYGSNQLAATESAVHHAYNTIVDIEEKSKLGIDNNSTSCQALLAHKLYKSPVIDKSEPDEIKSKVSDEVKSKLLRAPEKTHID